jgi:peptidoglycan/xylan/chitin deacetylase (PgdA/CDA1 family)
VAATHHPRMVRRRCTSRVLTGVLLVFVGCSPILVAHPAGAAPPSRTAAGPLQFLDVGLGQRGNELRLRVGTAGSVADWLHDPRATVCATLVPGLGSPVRVCIGLRRGSRVDMLDVAGHVHAIRRLVASVETRGTRTVVIAFPLDAIGVGAGPLGWSVRSRWAGQPCSASRPCVSRLPATGFYSMTVAAVLIGCTPAGEDLRFAAPEPTNEVALTFDDGPSAWTPAILGELESAHAVATFFVVGEHITGNETILRRMLRDGDALGNHSYSHPVLARDGPYAHEQIAETTALIWQASGYRPCLFRAPYGATSPELIADARSQGLLTTEWNVDPRDWSQPGVEAIVSTTLQQTRPGSIILLHDGGGIRMQTVEALPSIIRAIRGRGLRFVTVPELLGLRPRYVGAEQA